MIILSLPKERPKKFSVNASSFGCSVKLSWKPPASEGCEIIRYTVHYREYLCTTNATMIWQVVKWKCQYWSDYQTYGVCSGKHHLWLNCNKRYDIIVLAWNERGHSDFDEDSVLSVSTEKGRYPLYGPWENHEHRPLQFFSDRVFRNSFGLRGQYFQ